MPDSIFQSIQDNDTATDRARAEVAAKLAQQGSGLNPDYISLTEGVKPTDYVADTGVPYGSYPISGGLLQKVKWNDGTEQWDDYGVPWHTAESTKVNTWTDLGNIQGAVDGQVVELLGHSGAGDGGGGIIVWKTNSTKQALEGIISDPFGDGSPGRWERKIDEYIYPEQFGILPGAQSAGSLFLNIFTYSSDNEIPVKLRSKSGKYEADSRTTIAAEKLLLKSDINAEIKNLVFELTGDADVKGIDFKETTGPVINFVAGNTGRNVEIVCCNFSDIPDFAIRDALDGEPNFIYDSAIFKYNTFTNINTPSGGNNGGAIRINGPCKLFHCEFSMFTNIGDNLAANTQAVHYTSKDGTTGIAKGSAYVISNTIDTVETGVVDAETQGIIVFAEYFEAKGNVIKNIIGPGEDTEGIYSKSIITHYEDNYLVNASGDQIDSAALQIKGLDDPLSKYAYVSKNIIEGCHQAMSIRAVEKEIISNEVIDCVQGLQLYGIDSANILAKYPEFQDAFDSGSFPRCILENNAVETAEYCVQYSGFFPNFSLINNDLISEANCLEAFDVTQGKYLLLENNRLQGGFDNDFFDFEYITLSKNKLAPNTQFRLTGKYLRVLNNDILGDAGFDIGSDALFRISSGSGLDNYLQFKGNTIKIPIGSSNYVINTQLPGSTFVEDNELIPTDTGEYVSFIYFNGVDQVNVKLKDNFVKNIARIFQAQKAGSTCAINYLRVEGGEYVNEEGSINFFRDLTTTTIEKLYISNMFMEGDFGTPSLFTDGNTTVSNFSESHNNVDLGLSEFVFPGSVTTGNTNNTIAHGRGFTPDIDKIILSPKNDLGSATKFWVSAVDATNVTINVDQDPTSKNADFNIIVKP